MSENIEKTIDIEKILKGKMGAKSKYVPSFLVSWLKRIVHQDEVNDFLWESRGMVGTEWLEECVRYLDMTLVVKGRENLPDPNDGRLYTFVSNHPLGGEDGVALGAIIGRHYDSRFRYLVNDLLMNLPGLAPLCIPINKTGNQARNFPAMVEAGFKARTICLCSLRVFVRAVRTASFAICRGRRRLSRRAFSISVTWCLSISVVRTVRSSIGWLTSATASCHSISQ